MSYRKNQLTTGSGSSILLKILFMWFSSNFIGDPVPPSRNINTSANILIAISSGVLAFISRPIGDRISLTRSVETPFFKR